MTEDPDNVCLKKIDINTKMEIGIALPISSNVMDLLYNEAYRYGMKKCGNPCMFMTGGSQLLLHYTPGRKQDNIRRVMAKFPRSERKYLSIAVPC